MRSRHALRRIVFASALLAAMLPAPSATFARTIDDAVPDTTPPVVTSDAEDSYVASATITITAIDLGSGVDYVSYNLDGAG